VLANTMITHLPPDGANPVVPNIKAGYRVVYFIGGDFFDFALASA
jgi:hypothetical protein